MTQTQTNDSKNNSKGTAPQAPKTGRAKPYDLTIIGLDTKDDAKHPLYDRRIFIQLQPERIQSYAKWGVRKRVTVRLKDGRMELVDGRTRVRYARAVYDLQAEAKMPEDQRIQVEYDVVNLSDVQAWNYSRVLNQHDKSGGMMTAWEVVKTLSLNGRDYRAAAIDHGMSEQSIRNFERIATKLAPELQDKIEKKELTTTAAVELTYIPEQEQKDIVQELEDEGAEKSVDNVKKKKAAKQGKEGTSLKDKVSRVEMALRRYAGNPSDPEKVLNYVCKTFFGKAIEKLLEEKEEKASKK